MIASAHPSIPPDRRIVDQNLRQVEAFRPRTQHERDMKALNLRQLKAYARRKGLAPA